MIRIRKILSGRGMAREGHYTGHKRPNYTPALYVVSRDGLRIDAFLKRKNAERLVKSLEA